ncbi:protein PTCD3 homolog, mitochondrial-like [Gigantopelta aegis]|uniref:protein PTCD3 homolog, mitochondrial-like n=1 Tax=Gigantopelta aegis TaxID=1735272 RepID=UPI001B88ACC0|nr:protein PTCD3 homolog, mitochondrial-like [Gigantopelta aegis]
MAASMCSCCRRMFTRHLLKYCRYPAVLTPYAEPWSVDALRYSSVSASRTERASTKHLDTLQDDTDTIVIPRRKKRDSLSILKALASTVGTDHHAPHYKFIDDPYLIPTSSAQKRNFALSKASGKKAARYIIDHYSDFFPEGTEKPVIEAYRSSGEEQYTHQDASEDALLERINKRKVAYATEVYSKIKQNGSTVSEQTQLKLLDLLCVYNSVDPPPAMLTDEFFYRRDLGVDDRRPIRKVWNDNGLAERVFDDLTEKLPRAYNSVVKGRAKYLQCEKAFDLYHYMVDNKIPVDVSTYNALINIASYYQDSYDTKWQQTVQLMQDMHAAGVPPTVDTFNAVLYTLTRISHYKMAPSYACQTLAEMSQCAIEPSLTTWRHIIFMFYNHDEIQSPMLQIIIDYLQKKEFRPQDREDYDFFSIAMTKCFINLHDMELAMKLDAVLNTGDNIALLGDAFRESIYYSFFFRLICMFETIDKIMDYYEKFVPHIWTPNLKSLTDLLKAVELHDGYKYLPQIWSDLILFDYLKKDFVLGPLLSLMAKKPQTEELQNKFGDIAEYVVTKWQEDQDGGVNNPMELSGVAVGDLIIVALYAKRFDLAWKIFLKYREHGRLFSGIISEKSLVKLVDGCINEGDAEKAIMCLSMIHDLSFASVVETKEKVQSQMTLTDLQKEHLTVVTG